MARERYFQSQVVEVRELSELVRHVVLEREDGAALPYTAGQFIMIHFPDEHGVEINRSYSMSEPPEALPGRFGLCVKRVDGGRGSELIHSLGEGDTIKTSGPYGRFVLKNAPPRDIVLVATGTGVAPYRAMIPELRARIEAGHRIWLLFGVRTVDELLYHDEWRDLATQHPDGFLYRPVVSRPRPEASWSGPVGYVSAFLDELDAAIDPDDAIAYLCGVPAMIDDMRAALLERGFTRRTVKTEKYASPPPPGKKVALPPGKAR